MKLGQIFFPQGLTLVITLLLGITHLVGAQQPVRLVVMTDIGGDPDDQQSLVRLLVHSDLFILEVTDNGKPALTSFRRAIIRVK